MIRKLALAVAAVVVIGVVATAIALAVTAAEQPPKGSESAQRLESGPHATGRQAYSFVDESRPTAPKRKRMRK